ncbi:MAG: insulinase family protein [Pseudomonadota bacterium]
MNSPSNLPTCHQAFLPLGQSTIDSLNISVETFQHRETGAMHYHLRSDSAENVFLVALRTVPEDSTGVAHILEHTALCGSERYPVRDPFFMMLRRSLNTFMNAFTSSDWTAYPFASQNRKDFDNLLDVYLDAVFFSRLEELDFAQEGHRVEFETIDDPSSDLVFKGVVFNEMKGAMSAVTSTLWQTLCAELFSRSTYHHNSGGDPEHIPDLSYDQLTHFYRTHYHPSNATFMTFGNISAVEHQAAFEDRVLQHFEKLDQQIRVELEPRLDAPKQVSKPYAFDEEGDTEGKTHFVMGWLLGDSTNLLQSLEAQLLSSVLLENSASPLQQFLETTDLAAAPSPLCGLEDSMREMVFCCGVEGTDPEHGDQLEASIFGVLQKVAEEGVDQPQLEAVLHQLELHQREVSGDGMPYGLNLILQALSPATHYADPVEALDLDPVIEQLRDSIKDPNYIKNLARRLLLENAHRVTLIMTPDKSLSERRREQESSRLASLKAAMGDEDKTAVIERAKALLDRQAQEDDPEILPKVTVADVPESLPELDYTEQHLGRLPLTVYQQGTNGLVYQQLSSKLPQLDHGELAILPYLTGMATELGLGTNDYLATQHRQSSTVGSISLFTSMRGGVNNEQDCLSSVVLSSKALLSRAEEQAQLMYETLTAVRFDELDRIRDLIAQQRARREQSITGQGHSLAMTAATAGMSPVAKLHHELTGLHGIAQLRRLDDSLANQESLEAFAQQLQALHRKVLHGDWEALLVAEPSVTESVSIMLSTAWSSLPIQSGSSLALSEIREPRRECWVVNSQVSFCAKAYPTVPSGHSDAPALTVLGAFLRNGFLHRAIREQGGAYGGGASHDAGTAAFRFFSYRDPRIEGTLNDFDESIRWMLSTSHQETALEEAILGVIGSLDKPGSPAGEAKQDFHNRRFERDFAQRMAFREAVLGVSIADLKRVTETYLTHEQGSIAVLTGAAAVEENLDFIDGQGLEKKELG